MLPTPAELREFSERIRAAVSWAHTDEMKQQLAGHAFRLAQSRGAARTRQGDRRVRAPRQHRALRAAARCRS
jgi:hypothetical protein